jgi:hypothetical protein
MAKSELSIHLVGEAPKVTVKKFDNFSIVSIESLDTPRILFFLDSEQQVVNFENNLQWAFENFTDMKR